MRVLPAVNAGKPPDEWQTYDIRLVGMEVTTTLNGQKLYDKGVIDGLTGIAFDPFEGRPGPIELQGDHGSVEFRNIVLVPLTKRKRQIRAQFTGEFMKFRMLAVFALLTGSLQAQVTYKNLLHADQEPQNWLTYSGDYSSHRYSQLTQINRDNVKDLQMKWVYRPTGPRRPGRWRTLLWW